MNPPKIRCGKGFACEGESQFVPTTEPPSVQTQPLTANDTNGKTMFDLQTEHQLGFDKAGSGLHKFAVAYQLKQSGRVNEAAENFSKTLD